VVFRDTMSVREKLAMKSDVALDPRDVGLLGLPL
jgi:hypothetical protein